MRILPKDAAAQKAQQESEIARLTRELAEEREHSARLLGEIKELKFRYEILERSYGKQLDDARQRAVSAEKALSDQHTRNAELDTLRDDAIQLLSDTKAEIDQLTSERNQLQRQLAARGDFPVEKVGADPVDDGGCTINTLMNDSSWLKRQKPADEAKLKAEAERRKAEEEHAGDMLSPDTYLAAKGKSDSRS